MRLPGGWRGGRGLWAVGLGVWDAQWEAKKGDVLRVASWAAKRRFSGPTRSITIGELVGELELLAVNPFFF